MNCEKHVLLIDELVEGELDEQTAEKVSLHIFNCQSCAVLLETLEREKEIYSHYLFEVEPPVELAAKFQIRLEAEKPRMILAADSTFINRILAFLRFNPALATAALLILLISGFGLMSLVKEEQSLEKASAQQNIQLILPKITATPDETPLPEPKPVEEIVRSGKEKSEPDLKPVPVKQTVVKTSETKPKSPAAFVLTAEEEAQIKLVKELETETAKQVEKVELLLRSFRNARVIDGSEVYDIFYEKQQARKLLQTNIELRQRAETYGTLFTEQMLSRVEPYLLDIANLDLDSSAEQVLEIKQRVRNQNIIASLQGF